MKHAKCNSETYRISGFNAFHKIKISIKAMNVIQTSWIIYDFYKNLFYWHFYRRFYYHGAPLIFKWTIAYSVSGIHFSVTFINFVFPIQIYKICTPCHIFIIPVACGDRELLFEHTPSRFIINGIAWFMTIFTNDRRTNHPDGPEAIESVMSRKGATHQKL